MKKIFTVLFFLLSLNSHSQSESEFQSPLGIPIILSGTFAELRGNHFHGGLDIKTNGKEGYRVYATKEGFISRIKVQAGGYGKALYIEHPNGYTTVYGHLSQFNEEIAQYVKNQQYAKQSFEVDLYFSASQFPVERGEVIALSGNSGSSGGPHLHYEIRKTAGQIPINPLEYNFVKDDIKPTIYGIRIHDLSNGFYQSTGKTYDATYVSSGNYKLSAPAIANSSVIGVSVKSFDKLNGANNSNGFHSLSMYVDDQLSYEYTKNEVRFDESRYINAHIDYPEKQRGGGTFVNCFKLKGNHLGFLNAPQNDGRIWLSQYPTRNIRIEIKDFAGNISKVEFTVQKGSDVELAAVNSTRFFPHNQNNYYSDDELKLSLPYGSLYDDLAVNITQKDITTNYPAYSNFHQVQSEEIPLHSFMTVEVKQTNFPAELRNKALMGNLDSKGKIDVNRGKWIGDFFQVKTRNLGTYFITADTTAPTIRPYQAPSNNNFAAHSKIQFKINDDLSGIYYYRAEVDGKWILMEYDSKNAHLYHIFDDRISSGSHQLKLVVRDVVGNETVEELTFTR